jgi:hypothetical protein
LIVVLALLLAVSSVAVAASIAKSGKAVTALKVVTDDGNAEPYAHTTSHEWTDIPGMSTTIKVPSRTKGLLLITFSAETRCTEDVGGTSAQCRIRALVDSSVVAPGEVSFADAAGTTDADYPWQVFEAHSMQFVAGPLSAGTHTVTLQYQVQNGTPLFEHSNRTLSILRSKF